MQKPLRLYRTVFLYPYNKLLTLIDAMIHQKISGRQFKRLLVGLNDAVNQEQTMNITFCPRLYSPDLQPFFCDK